MRPPLANPSNVVLELAAALHGSSWSSAEQLCHTLEALGYEVTPQQVGAHASRLSREPCPPFEYREMWNFREYHLTRFGATELANTFSGIKPTYQNPQPVPALTAKDSDGDCKDSFAVPGEAA